MRRHPTHEMGPKGCDGCGVPPHDVLAVDPCPNSRCPRCHDLVGCCRCAEQGPRVGEQVVMMSAEPDAWDESADTIADVIRRDGDVWIVEVGHPRVHRVPEVFANRYGPSFGAAHTTQHGVVFFDGRWHHERDAEEQLAHRIAGTPPAPATPTTAPEGERP